jgi:hypothetical protein
VNGDSNNNNNNITINQKTDTLNRYLDNVINFNNVTRKSDSDSSHSSDHAHHGKMPSQPHQYRRQVTHHHKYINKLIFTANVIKKSPSITNPACACVLTGKKI